MAAATPQRLADFEILREIGRGGMGIVYEARQVSLNRKVAMKVLSGGLGVTTKSVQRFRREAEAAAKLHHTNIVPVYATGEENGTYFYAMELIDGPSLDHVIQQMRGFADTPRRPPVLSADGAELSPDLAQTGPYVEGAGRSGVNAGLTSSSLGSGSGYFDAVARMIAEVADALEHAHQEGVVHRDVKPSNLLLSPTGRLTVNDFGLARMLELPGVTMTGEFVGTPAYMSPEQITAGRTPLDHRTDIYSLGATLYELLTLHPPFRGERRDQVLAQILHKEPKAPHKVSTKVPIDLETICLKAMEKDPDRRYQTAGALAEDLRRFVNRFAIAARRAGTVEQLGKWVKRHPSLAAAVGAALVATVLAGFFALHAWRDRQERIAAETRARQEKQEEKQQQAVRDILMGDVKAADKAIEEALDLGAPEEWGQWRRGHLVFHNGDWEDAIRLLEPAADKMPDNLALHWLLATAYQLHGDYDGAARIVRRIDAIPPNAEEEYLYKGFATMPFTPKESLALLDTAVKTRGSMLAFGVRGVCLARLASDRTDLGLIKQAMDDATAAKRIMHDSAMALAQSVIVHHTAAILYEQSKKPKESAEALRIAAEDADALKLFSEVWVAVSARGTFLAESGKNEEAIQSFAKQKKLSRQAAHRYAWLLYEQGDADKASQVLEELSAGPRHADPSRAIFVADSPKGGLDRARKICDEMAGDRVAYGSFNGFFTQPALLFFLGEKQAALELCARHQAALDPGAGKTVYDRVVDYWENPDGTREKELLDFANRSKPSLVLAHWHIGIRQLADGDRAGARRHFEACLALHYPHFFGYLESRAFLARMDRDPEWPNWIWVKK
jgi:serine/threonine protein kinase/tetratricopeptide (TPR) repeat protein